MSTSLLTDKNGIIRLLKTDSLDDQLQKKNSISPVPRKPTDNFNYFHAFERKDLTLRF